MIRKITEETGAQIDVETTVACSSPRSTGRWQARHRLDQRPHRRGRGRQDLQRQGRAHHALRRVRRGPAQPGRPRAHLQAHRPPGRAGGGGSQRRRRDRRQAVEVDSQGRLNLSRQAAIDELTAKGEPIEEKIDKEAMATAWLAATAPREGDLVGTGPRWSKRRRRRTRSSPELAKNG